MDWTLRTNAHFKGTKGPLVLAVLDGVGCGSGDESDAVKRAHTPTLDSLWRDAPHCSIAAHGRAVGLPSDSDMGNSEVGHNALGCGRVYDQGALLVNNAISSGSIFAGKTWHLLVAHCIEHQSAMHFIGLLSDGNVHSHIDQLLALLRHAASEGVQRMFVHALLDGRDVGPTTALTYVERLEQALRELRTGARIAEIASGGGRMLVTMDRYQADWSIVERGYKAHVHGEGRRFPSAAQAIETFRDEQVGIGDQYLPAFVIERNDRPVGPIGDGDVVVNFNFRGDRAIEISRAFDDDEFDGFDRGKRPDVLYAGMMEYDGDLHIPRRFLVDPPAIDRTMGEYLVHNNISTLAISETQKYGHVTYFWNGNRSGRFDDKLETYIEVTSDRVPFDQRPWMKAAEITDRLIAELRTGAHRFARVNYANGDMVGHTGSLDATIVAMCALDLQLARLRKAVAELDGILVITADHGNADEMFQHGEDGTILRDQQTGSPVLKTSHTLNPVPLMIDDHKRNQRYQLDPVRISGAGIANVTATCLELLGFQAPDDYSPSLLRFQ